MFGHNMKSVRSDFCLILYGPFPSSCCAVCVFLSFNFGLVVCIFFTIWKLNVFLLWKRNNLIMRIPAEENQFFVLHNSHLLK